MKMKINTPIGELWLDADQNGLTKVSFHPIEEMAVNGAQDQGKKQEILLETERQLAEYFEGNRQDFQLPLSINTGTIFQQKVWQALQEIPYGEIRTYKKIAETIDHPKAVRAIGQANRMNPLPIVIPCHRVIGQNGQLTGYMGNAEAGLLIKRQLLVLEKELSE